jgi:2-dehydro-3-deoxyphosphogluconate aldolase/(4S)-4-hydroxy-2-oxoglutarate aldolase
MAALDAEECVDALMQRRYCSVLRTAEATAVAPLADAYIAGGIEVVEFTMTCPHRFEHIRDYARRGDCLVGLGTCLTAEDAARGISAGASFVVSPVFGEEVVQECVRQNKVVIPGCNTPTEMYNAHLLGAQFQKLFPAPEGGSGWVRSTLGALPMLQIVPTAGITGAH